MSATFAWPTTEPANTAVCSAFVSMQHDPSAQPNQGPGHKSSFINASRGPKSQRCRAGGCFGCPHQPLVSKASPPPITIRTDPLREGSVLKPGRVLSMHQGLPNQTQAPVPRALLYKVTHDVATRPHNAARSTIKEASPLAPVCPISLPKKRLARKTAPVVPHAIQRPEEVCQAISLLEFEQMVVSRGKTLGHGGQGRVELCKSNTGEFLAVKFICIPDGPQIDIVESLRSEKEIFERLQNGKRESCHPNIVGYRGMYWVGEIKDVAIIMDYINGYCLDEIKMVLGPNEIAALGVQLLKGVSYMHQRGVIHRDLKPSNIMVTKDGIVKIIDFGLSVLDDSDDFDRTGCTGTLGFIAPEVERRKPCTPAVDIWAVGKLLQMCLDGIHPSDHVSSKPASSSRDQPLPVPKMMKGGFPLSLCGVLHRCQIVDPEYRSTAPELLKAEFFQRDYDQLDLVRVFKSRNPFKRCLNKIGARFKSLA